jgi:hypothetical protein
MLVFVVLLGVVFILSILLSWLWLFCERDWIGVFAICFGVALFVSGFVYGRWWWLAAIEGALLVSATVFHHLRAPAPAGDTSDYVENDHDTEWWATGNGKNPTFTPPHPGCCSVALR